MGRGYRTGRNNYAGYVASHTWTERNRLTPGKSRPSLPGPRPHVVATGFACELMCIATPQALSFVDLRAQISPVLRQSMTCVIGGTGADSIRNRYGEFVGPPPAMSVSLSFSSISAVYPLIRGHKIKFCRQGKKGSEPGGGTALFWAGNDIEESCSFASVLYYEPLCVIIHVPVRKTWFPTFSFGGIYMDLW